MLSLMSGVFPTTRVVTRPPSDALVRWRTPDLMRYVFGVALLVALYYGTAQIGYAFEFAGPVAAVVWLPVGVGIAFLYIGGLRFWPGVLAGDLLVKNYSALPVGSARLARSTAPPRAWWTERVREGVLLVVAVAGLSELAFASPRPLTYLVFPALIWAALRFGRRGATLAIVIVAGFAIWETTHYVGPFVFHSIPHSVLETQLFIAVAALTTLSLAAMVSEREQVAGRLASSRVRLVEATHAERRRLEHNLHDGAQQRLTALVVHLGLAADRARRVPQDAGML